MHFCSFSFSKVDVRTNQWSRGTWRLNALMQYVVQRKIISSVTLTKNNANQQRKTKGESKEIKRKPNEDPTSEKLRSTRENITETYRKPPKT